MSDQIRVFVVDDHQVVREGIISLIEENEKFIVCGEAQNGKEALMKIKGLKEKPEVVLMDVNMPVIDGIECTDKLYKTYGDTIKILALTMMNQSMYIRKMLHVGATGYILKNCDKEELYRAIETVYRNDSYFSQSVSREVMKELSKAAKNAKLVVSTAITKREIEVLNLIVRGMSNQEIADELFISIRTVETHKQNLLSKTDTSNIAGLVVYAIRNNLVDI